MKKILSLFAILLMAISASAQEKVLFDPEASYGNGAILSSENTVLELGNDRATANYNMTLAATKAYCSDLFGQKVMVENSDTHEMEEKTRVAYVYGANNPLDGELDADDKSTGISYSPSSGNLPQSGTYYMITPAKDGHITAFIVLNANKNLYVVKGSTGECLPVSALTLKADGSSPTVTALNDDYTVAAKTTGTIEFDVFGGETYYVFCTGSKLSFGGYVFVEGVVEPEPVDTRERVMFDPQGTYGNGATLTSEHTQVVLGNDRATANYNLALAATKAYCSDLLGQKVMVENSETGVMEEKTRVVYVYGANNPLDSLLNDEDKSRGVSYDPAIGNLPQSGTYYMITPSIDGHVTAFIILNANKKLYVVKGSTGECLPVSALTLKADGSSPTETALNDDYTLAAKTTGTVEFDVDANETYYLFCTGSKLSFGGYLFEVRTVIPEPIDTREIVKFSADGTYGNGAIETSEHTQVVLGDDRTTKNYNLKFAVTNTYCSNLLGQKGMVENSETGEMEEKTGVWYVVGDQNPKDGALDGDKSTGSGYKPSTRNLPESGTYYMITTTIPGHITAFVIVNASKNFYVVKKSNGECLPVDSLTLKADGVEPTEVTLNEDFTLSSKMTGTVEFNVEANETYYVFCTGSKLSFGGYEFVSGNGGGNGGESILGDANGDGEINITDVTIMVDYILTKNTQHINIANANVNGDEEVNITDVSILVDMILNNHSSE
ncbi:MAG: dockerin type I repeat-containing protein [Prevotella sp.]|nr:dockerin type I repeat-containing protein [Prevotella sp.]